MSESSSQRKTTIQMSTDKDTETDTSTHFTTSKTGSKKNWKAFEDPNELDDNEWWVWAFKRLFSGKDYDEET